jgi:hypothetical protein
VATSIETWFYDRFVRFLDPGDYDPESGILRGLSMSLPHAGKPGATMRIGVGSAVLVTDDRVLVAADVVPTSEPSSDVVWRRLADLTPYRMRINILLDPPQPPFLFVAFGKKPDVRALLRLTVSRDVIEFCGEGAMTVRRRPVMAAYEQLDGIPAALYRTLAALVYGSNRDPRQVTARNAIEKLLIKHGELGQLALDVAMTGPHRYTDEYNALSRLLTAREKQIISMTDE